MGSTVLSVKDVTVDFDGFKALNQLSFELRTGELCSVIGPNGAGKTTLLDVISGKIRPVEGRVRFLKKHNLTRSEEHEIVRMGIGRKFQTPSIFPNLTVYENLELAAGYREKILHLLAPLSSKKCCQVQEVLERIRLKDKSAVRAGILSHGEKQWLEIGMLLIQKPKVLLLDEPVAGMTRKERQQTGRLLQAICQEISVVVVEHDMEFVREFATRVTVLHEGQTLCEGSPREVQQDPRVIEAYLGRGTLQKTVA